MQIFKGILKFRY